MRFDHGRRSPTDAMGVTRTGDDFITARDGCEMARLPDILDTARIPVHYHESIVRVLGFVQRLLKFAMLSSELQSYRGHFVVPATARGAEVQP